MDIPCARSLVRKYLETCSVMCGTLQSWQSILPECHSCMIKVSVVSLPSSDVHRAVQLMFHMLLWSVPSLLWHTFMDGRWWISKVTDVKKRFGNNNNHTHFEVTLVWLMFLFFWDTLLCCWALQQHYIPSKCWESNTHRHSMISQKSRILNHSHILP